VRILPPSQQEPYVRDIRLKYKADIVVSILQELSRGMTAIFVGLLTNYLYERTKSKANERQIEALRRALRNQRTELSNLKRQLNSSKNQQSRMRGQQRYDTYDTILTKIETSDPSITKAVDDAIKQLEQRGAESLRDEVNSKYRWK
jgi:intergrase/recombinase